MLNVQFTTELDHLPDKINELHKLEVLDISYSRVSSLPNLKLTKLHLLDLHRTPIVDDSTIPDQILWDIVRFCPLLGCLGEDEEKFIKSPEYNRLCYEMNLNRARSCVIFIMMTLFFSNCIVVLGLEQGSFCF
jgi:Leucine-rich repeat (LRR) protein